MKLDSYIAALFNNLLLENLEKSVPSLSLTVFKANACLFYRMPESNTKPNNLLSGSIQELPVVDPNKLVLAGAVNSSESFQRIYKINLSQAASVANSLQPCFIGDLFNFNSPATEQDRQISLQFGYRSFLSIPILGKDKFHGILVLFYTLAQQYGPELITDISSWSRFCGIALDQAVSVPIVLPQEDSPAPIIDTASSEKPDINGNQIGLLAASISHELNNSLDGINNYLYLISSETPPEHAHKEYLKIIESEIARTGKIVQQLADLYQPGKIPKLPVQLNELIHSVIPLLNHLTKGNNYHFELKLDKRLPEILGVPEQLKSVFLNLFINAIQSMPEGGIITVQTERDVEDPHKVQITVADTGAGIPPDDVEHIFQPFYTTKKSGTGLGLTICRQIIKFHEGNIMVNPLQDKGTQFIITLPIHVKKDPVKLK